MPCSFILIALSFGFLGLPFLVLDLSKIDCSSSVSSTIGRVLSPNDFRLRLASSLAVSSRADVTFAVCPLIAGLGYGYGSLTLLGAVVLLPWRGSVCLDVLLYFSFDFYFV